MDDEKVAYKGYEKMVKAGIKNVCVHKGLFAPGIEKQFPHLRGFADVADVGQAAKDWPQLNFVIYHSAYRHVSSDPEQALAGLEAPTARFLEQLDLADLPAGSGVNNVYHEPIQRISTTLVAEAGMSAPADGHIDERPAAFASPSAPMRCGPAHRNRRSKGLRRLGIPEAMQKKNRYTHSGQPNGAMKSAITRRDDEIAYNVRPGRTMLDVSSNYGLT